jgi:hypothetical protein
MATVTLTFTDPTTRMDGSALPPASIASVDIFDSVDGNRASQIGTVQTTGLTFTTGVISAGVHAFTAVVNDTTGHSSAASNVVTVTVVTTIAPPSPITDLAGVLNP